MVRVLVLLMGGIPPSLITMGRRYKSCFCRLNPPRRAYTPAVLSVGRGETRCTRRARPRNHRLHIFAFSLADLNVLFSPQGYNQNPPHLFFNLDIYRSHSHLAWQGSLSFVPSRNETQKSALFYFVDMNAFSGRVTTPFSVWVLSLSSNTRKYGLQSHTLC